MSFCNGLHALTPPQDHHSPYQHISEHLCYVTSVTTTNNGLVHQLYSPPSPSPSSSSSSLSSHSENSVVTKNQRDSNSTQIASTWIAFSHRSSSPVTKKHLTVVGADFDMRWFDQVLFQTAKREKGGFIFFPECHTITSSIKLRLHKPCLVQNIQAGHD